MYLARLWPLLLRLAIGLYFIYPHINQLLGNTAKIQEGFFGCIGSYIPLEIAYSLWHGFFVVLGLLVIGLMRSIFPLIVSLTVLGLSLYIDFAKGGYSVTTMLLFILVMVNISLILYTANPRFRQ
jgi:uncharacterized membrane protein YphA (DoxX/SURF4 family)